MCLVDQRSMYPKSACVPNWCDVTTGQGQFIRPVSESTQLTAWSNGDRDMSGDGGAPMVVFGDAASSSTTDDTTQVRPRAYTTGLISQLESLLAAGPPHGNPRPTPTVKPLHTKKTSVSCSAALQCPGPDRGLTFLPRARHPTKWNGVTSRVSCR